MSADPTPERVSDFLAQLARMAGGQTHLRMALAGDRDWLDAAAYGINVVAAELTYLKDSAESASRAKSAFLANTSHEIRTPITAMLGSVELLMRFDLPREEQLRYLEIARASGRTLVGIIDDILDLSKVEAGRLDLVEEPVDLDTFLSDSLRAVDARARAKSLDFEVISQLPPGATILADSLRLRQIILNLVGNAIKFSERGRVAVSAVRSPGKNGAHWLCLTVSDNGIGIAPEKAAQLFQPFMQADESIRRKFGGTGLGLAISRRLAEAMGGSLELLRSEPGQGSSFQLRLPYREVSPPRPPGAEARASAEPDLSGLRVLLVDDNPSVREVIAAALTRWKVQVAQAADGVAGVELALRGGFDLILMDVQMAELDGLSATRLLRSRGVRTRIVAITAHAMEEHRAQCLGAGCDGYLAKPVSLDDLMAAVARAREKA